MQLNNHIRLIYSAGGIAIAFFAIFGIVYINIGQTHTTYVEKVEHTHEVLSAINTCEKFIIDAESTQRGYLLSNQSEYRQKFEAVIPNINEAIDTIGHLIADNPQQWVFYRQFKKFAQLKVDLLRLNLDSTQSAANFLERMHEGANAMENARRYMGKMRTEEERLLTERVSRKDAEQEKNTLYFRTTFFAACLICIVLIVVFLRELRKRIVAQQSLTLKMIELSNSNSELEEIAFAASHDLQEPMRKIRILSSLMIKSFEGKVSSTEMEIVHRVNKVTEQMHLLLNDLVMYTHLLKKDKKPDQVDLYEIFKVAHDKVFQSHPVQYQLHGQLPVIQGFASQLETLAIQLFDNSLKFKSPDRELVITISYKLKRAVDLKPTSSFAGVSMIHEVSIADNGIGFDEQYAKKIFGLFKRLHTQTAIPGKGMGLAIARRVMINHKGQIVSRHNNETGAEFILQFPADT